MVLKVAGENICFQPCSSLCCEGEFLVVPETSIVKIFCNKMCDFVSYLDCFIGNHFH